jgi:hypothetical protein
MPGIVLGFNAKLYISSNLSYLAPVWLEAKDVQDNTLSLDKDKANVTTRGSGGWVAEIGTLKTGGLAFKMIWDTTDPVFALILAAFLNNTSIEVQCLDGPNTPPGNGSQGLQAFMNVTKCERDEPLTEALTASVEISPTYYPAYPPTWITI